MLLTTIPWPAAPDPDERPGGPVFIVGAQRSGTTLLRLILNAHPELAIPAEARFLSPHLNRRMAAEGLQGQELARLVDYLRADLEFRAWDIDHTQVLAELGAATCVRLADLFEALHGSYAASRGKRIWGDKSLFFREVALLHDVFPGARFVHIVRDGRAVFDSWRRFDSTKDNAAAVGLDWSIKTAWVERAFARLPAGLRTTVRYEDLVAEPARQVEALCRFLQLEFVPDMLDYHETADRFVGSRHSDLIFQPVDQENAERWRQRLTQSERRAFETVARRQLRLYGYEVSDAGGVRGWGAALTQLAGGVPRRLQQVWVARRARRRAARTGSASDLVALDPGRRARKKR